MSNTTYHVFQENTLVYKHEGTFMYGVLGGSVLKGGRDWRNGPICCDETDLRPATKADFDEYNICWKGHLNG